MCQLENKIVHIFGELENNFVHFLSKKIRPETVEGLLPVLDPVTFSLDNYRVAMVHQSVQDGCS